MKRKKGFTLIELLVVVAIIALLISILLPSLSRAREITKRAVCASNLRGIGQAMKVYSNANFDFYPTTPFTEASTSQGITNVSFQSKMAKYLTVPLATENYSSVHPSRSLFILVYDMGTAPKQFICPSSGDQEDDLRNYESGGNAYGSQPGTNRFDFRGYPFLSYGYQLPYAMKARPSESLDPRNALMADKGPFATAGDPGEDPETITDKTSQPGDPIALEGATTEQDVIKADNDKWRIHNSRNHNQEGENILFADGHAEFLKKPIAGVNYDNVYTMHTDYSGDPDTLLAAMLGTIPVDTRGPYTHTDSLIVP